jgi:hypothetical protein
MEPLLAAGARVLAHIRGPAGVYSGRRPDKRAWVTSARKLYLVGDLRGRKQLACRVAARRPGTKKKSRKDLQESSGAHVVVPPRQPRSPQPQNSTLAVNVAGDPVELCSTDAVSL